MITATTVKNATTATKGTVKRSKMTAKIATTATTVRNMMTKNARTVKNATVTTGTM